MRQFISGFLDAPSNARFLANPDGGPGVFIYDSSKPLQGLQAFGFEAAEEIERLLEPNNGDAIILQARAKSTFSGGSTALGDLRSALHRAAVKEGLLATPLGFAPLWITDFPLFSPESDADATEPSQAGSAGLAATHHPFTSPKTAADVDLLATDPARVIGDHYDLVLNGVELGGGSRRIHNADVQRYVMQDVLRMSEARIQQFSHLLQALRAGCPPHAGIALGFDRLVAVMLGKESLRDVIAFPKTGKGDDAMMKSPGPLTEDVLTTYHLKVR
jgi:aspartyl-tRNA synthetase